MKIIDKAEGISDTILRGMRPDEVDGILADLEDADDRIHMQMVQLISEIHRGVGDRYDRSGWGMSHERAFRMARDNADLTAARRWVAAYDTATAELKRTLKACKRFNNEWRRRKWKRAFIVTDGHVHSSKNCSSCNKGIQLTRFIWLPELSGKTEDEIVGEAKDRACTICYPKAPVARGLKVGPSSLGTPEERERQAAKAEREQIRTEKTARAAANAITNVDGTPLRDEVDRDGKQRGSVIKTLRTARSDLKRECWYQYAWGDKDGCRERNIQHLARAVAWREAGLPTHAEPTREQIDAVISPLRKKVVKEIDKERKSAR